MIDVALARDLFSAVPQAAILILVGDKDQLPSVGPGRVFADLISIPEITTVSLTHLYRRQQESTITSIAHVVNSGALPLIPEPDGETRSDAYFIARAQPEEAATLIEKLVGDQIPKKFGLTWQQICVLTPSNRGPLGTLALNNKLQQRLNPCRDPEQELSLNDLTLRLGDRVAQRVNNYNLDPAGVFNGDGGCIVSVDRSARSLVVELWDGRLIKYEHEDLAQLSLAYAMSVHRSQGSEFPCVVLALHESHFTLLERQLIYTAITRAKKLLIIVGSRRALALGCKRTNAKRRCTRLRERFQALCKN
jgi:exodeoxyribonuclease V alpha subunit